MKRPAILYAGRGLERLLAARLAARYQLLPFAGANALSLGAAVLQSGAVLVHLHTSLAALGRPGALAGIAAAKLCGAAVVCEMHGGALPARPLPAWQRAAAALPDALIAPSAAEAEAYRECLPAQLVVHIAPGIEGTPYQRYNRASLSADSPLRLVYLGRLVREQGLPEAIEALRLVRGRGLAARLVLAGSGPEEPRLRHQVADAGLTRDVVFVGEAAGGEKARLLSQADILVFAAYRAGVPRVLLEAMAAGVVPVASAVGGIPEVVTPNEHGVLIEPRDACAIAEAIARLANARVLLARMSAACRRRVAAAFSLERLAAELAALYFTLTAAPRPRAAL